MHAPRLTRDLKLMITFSGLRNVADLFLGTFLISFIMQLSENELVATSTYKLCEYAATCAGFFLFANWCKRYNKVAVFALNLIPKIILLVSIILLGNRVAEFVIPLGLLYGIGAAMYHLPMNAMIGEKNTAATTAKYVGFKNAMSYTAKIVAPIVLGFFINTASYTEMAYALLGIAIIELVMVCFLTPSHHRSTQPIDFGGFARCMMRFPIIRKIFAMEALRGFGIGLLGTVITIYTVYMFKTDLNLGIFTTIFAACSGLTSWLLGQYGKQKHYPRILNISVLAILITLMLFVWRTTPTTFLLYNFIYATAIVVLDQLCGVNMFNLSKSRCVTRNHKIEYFVFRDFALFIGRWVGFTGLMYIGVFGGYDWLRWYLIPITASILAAGIIAIRISPHIRGR